MNSVFKLPEILRVATDISWMSSLGRLACSHPRKVTGKAVMLDEIINYLQSLQSQVEVIIQVTGIAMISRYILL
ncbi:unnamed protein product [Urochloa humidicola]